MILHAPLALMSFSTLNTWFQVVQIVSLLIAVAGIGLFIVMHSRDVELQRRWRQIQLERWLKQQLQQNQEKDTPCS